MQVRGELMQTRYNNGADNNQITANMVGIEADFLLNTASYFGGNCPNKPTKLS